MIMTTLIFSGIHHYEADEVKTSDGVSYYSLWNIRVGVGQSVSFFDDGLNQQVTKNKHCITYNKLYLRAKIK